MSKPKFDLSHLQVTPDSRSIFTFWNIPGDPEPWIEMRPATENNKAFFNEVLRRGSKNLRRLQAKGDNDGVSPVMLEESRDEDRELYPELVCGDRWGGKISQPDGSVVDLDKVPCNVENRRAFIEALPAFIFDKLRQHCQNDANFSGRAPSAAETEATAKN